MDETVRDTVLDLLDLYRDIADGAWPSAARLLERIDPAPLLVDGAEVPFPTEGDPVGVAWQLAYQAVEAALGGRPITRASWERARAALAAHLAPWMGSQQQRD
ncbi:MAG: hypothetical protein KatS3mg051_2152 [Anaerolineae bacterium]|nr:MAG: hypothetical protein KatS3mg051_2115 [Anaerolineae bacterium]GIV82798.1 MAG: hypothetical protein KatS3mg051_2152 [Anaerolineae bacterium]